MLKELRKRNGLGSSVLTCSRSSRCQRPGHPKVFVTPHAAATSDPVHLAPIMLRQMDAFERGEKLDNLVDRKAGY